MEIRQILIAIDPCNMDADGRATLTIGKEYEVIKTDKDWLNVDFFVIIDNESSEHQFDLSTLTDFFELKKQNNEYRN